MSSGGNFSLGHFVDPLGIVPGVGQGKGGGAKNVWDPANIFTSGSKSGQSPADQIAATPVPTPVAPITPASPEVLFAQKEFAREQAGKMSIAKTVWAGDTGGYRPGGQNPANALPLGMRRYRI